MKSDVDPDLLSRDVCGRVRGRRRMGKPPTRAAFLGPFFNNPPDAHVDHLIIGHYFRETIRLRVALSSLSGPKALGTSAEPGILTFGSSNNKPTARWIIL